MRLRASLLLVAGLLLTSCDDTRQDEALALDDGSRAAWSKMVAVEERIHALRPAMGALARAVANLHLPDEDARDVFDVSVAITDLAPGPPAPDTRPLSSRPWPLAASAPPVGGRDLDLWRPLLDGVDHFRDVRFKVVEGRFEEQGAVFDSDAHFSGLASAPLRVARSRIFTQAGGSGIRSQWSAVAVMRSIAVGSSAMRTFSTRAFGSSMRR